MAGHISQHCGADIHVHVDFSTPCHGMVSRVHHAMVWYQEYTTRHRPTVGPAAGQYSGGYVLCLDVPYTFVLFKN